MTGRDVPELTPEREAEIREWEPFAPEVNVLLAKIDRLRAEVERLTNERSEAIATAARAMENRDVANADAERLAEAAAAWDATLSEYCDGPERDALRVALRQHEEQVGNGPDVGPPPTGTGDDLPNPEVGMKC